MARPVAVELSLPVRPGGLLDLAQKFPGGWERGVAFQDSACLTTTLVGECPQVTGLAEYQRPSVATFTPVVVQSAVKCSTMGNVDVGALAGSVAAATADFAVSREMLTGEISERDTPDDSPFGPNPSLVGAAQDLGATHTTLAKALACLEATIAEDTEGRTAVLLVGYDWLTYAVDAQLLRWDGNTWRTPAGSLVIPASGFDGRAPGSTEPPDSGDALYAYAVVGVWAQLGRQDSFDYVNRAINDQLARSDILALFAFPTCAVYAAASTVATAC